MYITVTFTWKKQKDYPPDIKGYDENSDIRKNNYINHGFIAQEVKEAIDKHESIKDGFGGWSIDDDNIQQVGDGAFMPMVIKALQELSEENKELQKQNQKLEKQNQELEKRIELLENK